MKQLWDFKDHAERKKKTSNIVCNIMMIMILVMMTFHAEQFCNVGWLNFDLKESTVLFILVYSNNGFIMYKTISSIMLIKQQQWYVHAYIDHVDDGKSMLNSCATLVLTCDITLPSHHFSSPPCSILCLTLLLTSPYQSVLLFLLNLLHPLRLSYQFCNIDF